MLQKLLGNFFGGSVVTAAEGIGNVIDKFVETEEEKTAADLLKRKLLMKPGLAQVELNKVEAGHRSIFVAGWRPWIGWVAGFSLALYFIPQFVMGAVIWTKACYEILSAVTLTAENITTVLPPYPVNGDALLELVIAMLGLAGLRTLEKGIGKTK